MQLLLFMELFQTDIHILQYIIVYFIHVRSNYQRL